MLESFKKTVQIKCYAINELVPFSKESNVCIMSEHMLKSIGILNEMKPLKASEKKFSYPRNEHFLSLIAICMRRSIAEYLNQ